jgi:BA14K-like protein
MRSKLTIVLAALALGGAIAGTPAFAQSNGVNGKPINDGGMPAEPSGAAQYNSTGAVVAAPGNESSNCEARFRSFDPATGTYLGRDGQRHPCP